MGRLIVFRNTLKSIVIYQSPLLISYSTQVNLPAGIYIGAEMPVFYVWRFADIILMLWLTDTEVPVQSAKILKAFIETAVQICSELLISGQY